MLTRTIRTYPSLPSLPPRGPLPPMVGVVLPLARTNLVTNPSIELATTGYTAKSGSIARSATQQYHGTYSLAVTPTAGDTTDGAYYTITLTAGTVYALSCKFLGVLGGAYKIGVFTTADAQLAAYRFHATGRWQWVTLIYTEAIGATRRFYFNKDATASTSVFYVDGVQVETISDGVLQATTYIDGDQIGLLPGQQPPAYGWNGTPHASTSYRTALTRAGGYVMNLRDAYGFILTGLIGLGMAAPNNVSIPYSVLDGARYLRTTKPPRTLSLPGRFFADTIDAQMRQQSAMRAAFDRDAVPLQQPLQLSIEPQDECGNTIGDFAFAQCLYAGGLEGNESNYPAEDAAPTFTMYVPFLIGGSAGAALDPQDSISNTNTIAQRSTGGVWSNLGTGMSGGLGTLLSIGYGLDKMLYAGGSFTDAGGSGADFFAKWNGSAWAVVKSATSINAVVRAQATGADGRIYIGGDFINADGIAAADYIAVYDPVGDTYAALGTGAGSVRVFALAFDSTGNLFAGGDFTSMGGVANTAGIAKWNGSAWVSVGNVAGGTGAVLGLASDDKGGVYAVGNFTSIGGVSAVNAARWNGTAWVAMATSANAGINAVAVAPSGLVYVGGDFTTINGVSAAYIAVWNGTGFAPVGSGLNNSCFVLTIYGNLVFAGGSFSQAGGLTLPDRGAIWNGSAWLPLDADFPGSTSIFAASFAIDGTFTVGFNTSGTMTTAGQVTLTNDSVLYAYPIVTINGPSSGTSRIYSIVNISTNQGVWFNLTISVGEVVTLNFNPQQQSFVSTFQGDITNKILPGSNTAQFYLAPGNNTISFFAASSTVTAIVSWQKRYNGVADLVSP